MNGSETTRGWYTKARRTIASEVQQTVAFVNRTGKVCHLLLQANVMLFQQSDIAIVAIHVVRDDSVCHL